MDTGTAMPWAGGSVATAYINGKVYAAGGIVGSSTVNNAAVYDPANDTWTTHSFHARWVAITPLPEPMEKILHLRWPHWRERPVRRIQRCPDIRPATNTWQWTGDSGSTLAPLPQPRGGMGKAVFYGNEFYVMGGETTNAGTGQVAGNVYNRVDVYNPTTNTWRLETLMPTARHGISPFVADGKIFVAGGGVQSGHSNSIVFEIFAR